VGAAVQGADDDPCVAGFPLEREAGAFEL